MNKLLSFILFAVLFISVTSCHREPVKDAGTVDIEFDNIAVVNDVQRQLSLVTPGSDDYTLSNGLGQEFNINLLRYYITNIKLEGPDGALFEDKVEVDATKSEGVYLIDESDLTTGKVTLSGVPAGSYNKITFTVGVEENAVEDGAAGGTLDPATCNMFWNWNSGYIALKFEGQSPVSAGGAGGETINDIEKGMAYHIGGWKDIDDSPFVYNNKTVTLDFDTNAKIEKGEQPEVHLTFDVLKLFAGKNMIDFTGNNNVHKPVDGKAAAENIPGAFAFDHIHQ